MAAKVVIFQPGPLRGEVGVPGDKSISHRALIAGACCNEPLRIARLNQGRDVLATREALTALGARIEADGDGVVVHGGRLHSPPGALECMNSGSTARMLLGVCAGANVAARFDGDESLRSRPMEPVAAQLRAFGARIETTGGRLPLAIAGTPEIETRRFILLEPSAQVKSALLFAGLFAGVSVDVTGDRGSRDHTERLLRYLAAEIEWNGREIRLGEARPASRPIEVAGDFSAAAFLITAAAVTPGSSIVVRDVGTNPTRTGLLDALLAMGAAVELRRPRTLCGEPVADVAVEWRPLRGTTVSEGVALRAVDEIPLIAAAGAFAAGATAISGVAGLRAKESDRIAAIERLTAAVGVEASFERGVLTVRGGRPAPTGAAIETQGDHRIAMTAAVLACGAGRISADGEESLDVSFPGFRAALDGLQRG
ncbi:MAG TPA: 3-phosphoshikimate 1-carboxyvinyltransferase [Candidatus Binatia bacterium]|nr:3-phosphoshikimate 1-carboxyvinyltransferase [Candidatus Binatia bacterium]